MPSRPIISIVTRRNNLWLSLKDGAFWGLGHTSTIVLVDTVLLLGRFALHKGDLRYIEAAVGAMVISLGFVWLYRLKCRPTSPAEHKHTPNKSDYLHTQPTLPEFGMPSKNALKNKAG